MLLLGKTQRKHPGNLPSTVPYLPSPLRQTDRHTDIQTCSSQYFATAPAGAVTSNTWITVYLFNVISQQLCKLCRSNDKRIYLTALNNFNLGRRRQYKGSNALSFRVQDVWQWINEGWWQWGTSLTGRPCIDFPSVPWHCWLGNRKGLPPERAVPLTPKGLGEVREKPRCNRLIEVHRGYDRQNGGGRREGGHIIWTTALQ